MVNDLLLKIGRKLSSKINEKEIKCVLLGDNAVGKTKLICSYVYNLPCTSISLLNSSSHTPTIFANDNVDKKTADYQLRHKFAGKYINLVIWDTFGDHDKDRAYSYLNADVVLICFNVGSFSSLENVASYWSKEVKRFCPGVPIFLVGLQSDRRHNDPNKYFCQDLKIQSLRQYLYSERNNRIPKKDKSKITCIESEIGRKLAHDIGAFSYFETSVATRFGVNELFSAAVKLGMMKRMKVSEKEFKAQKSSMIQSPYLKERSRAPDIYVRRQNIPFLFNHIFEDVSEVASKLTDVEFVFKDNSVFAHCFILVLSVPTFGRLFQQIGLDNSQQDLSGDMSAFRNYTVAEDPNQPRFQIEMSGKSDIFKSLLEFYYTGTIRRLGNMKELLDMASHCNLRKVRQYLFNILTEEPEQNCILKSMLSAHIQNAGRRFLRKSFLADMAFFIGDDIEVPVHKVLLAQRSEVLSAMLMHGNFVESVTSKVDFRETNLESFQSVLEYLYTGECRDILDFHGTLQLANFLCLRHLVSLCEDKISKHIVKMKETNDQDVYTFVIASYIVGEYHNAPQLSAWCLHFMATNYNDLCKDQGKEMKNVLEEKTLKYLEENRWPPVWYLKEQDYYERTMQRMLSEQNKKKEKKRRRICSGCF